MISRPGEHTTSRIFAIGRQSSLPAGNFAKCGFPECKSLCTTSRVARTRPLKVNQIPGNFQQEEAFNGFLLLLNVSTLQEARQLPSSALVQANIRQVGASAYGLNTYGPVIDGLFAPGIPGKLLLQGSFDHNLKLMLGYNANEGLVFTSPFLPNDTSYDDYFESSFPSISPRVASYVQNVLYPAPSDNTPYEDNIGRASVTIAESTFVCNTIYLERVCNSYCSSRPCPNELIFVHARHSGTKRTRINSACPQLSTAKTLTTRSSTAPTLRSRVMRQRLHSRSILQASLQPECRVDRHCLDSPCMETIAESSTSTLPASPRSQTR